MANNHTAIWFTVCGYHRSCILIIHLSHKYYLKCDDSNHIFIIIIGLVIFVQHLHAHYTAIIRLYLN